MNLGAGVLYEWDIALIKINKQTLVIFQLFSHAGSHVSYLTAVCSNIYLHSVLSCSKESSCNAVFLCEGE